MLCEAEQVLSPRLAWSCKTQGWLSTSSRPLSPLGKVLAFNSLSPYSRALPTQGDAPWQHRKKTLDFTACDEICYILFYVMFFELLVMTQINEKAN